MISIILYYNKAESNRLDKTNYIVQKLELQGNFIGGANIINPAIKIQLNEDNFENFLSSNYCYIPKFKRYYFINNYKVYTNQIFEISLTVDTLMSFKEDILNLDVVCMRQEYENNKLLKDDLLPFTQNKKIIYKKFGEFLPYVRSSSIQTYVINIIGENFLYEDGQYLVNTCCSVTSSILVTENLLYVNNLLKTIIEFTGDLKGNFVDNNSQLILSINILPFSLIEVIRLMPRTIDYYFEFREQNKDKGYIYINKQKFTLSTESGTNTINGAYYVLRLRNDVTYNANGIINLGNFYLDINNLKNYNNFIDINLSKHLIYLPFYGWYELNLEDLYNEEELQIRYYLDINNCKLNILLSLFRKEEGATVADNIRYAELNCDIGCPVKFNLSNEGLIKIQNQLAKDNSSLDAANNIIKIIGGIIATVGGTMSANPIIAGAGIVAIGSGAVGVAKSENNKLIQSATNLPSYTIHNIPSNSYFQSYEEPYYMHQLNLYYMSIISKCDIIENEDNYKKYAKLYGIPSTYIGKLSTLYGYTQVGGVHIEDIKNATDNEKDDINNKLKSGILLQDKPE